MGTGTRTRTGTRTGMRLGTENGNENENTQTCEERERGMGTIVSIWEP